MSTQDLITHAAVYILGIGTAVFASYLSSWLNDNRKSKSNKKKRKKELNSLMVSIPELLKEMRQDFNASSKREFIVLPSKGVVYNSNSQNICYYESEHSDLKHKLHVLRNLDLIEDITYNNTPRFKITEEFYEHLNK